jgi:hypothetical protein
MRGRFNDQIVDIAAVEFDSQLGLQPPVVHNFAARKEIHEPTPPSPHLRSTSQVKTVRLKLMLRSDLPALIHSFMDRDHCTKNEPRI